MSTAQARIGKFWSLTTSQVYRELAAMERQGLIEAGEKGPRDRKPYLLTEAGRTAFAEWIDREPGDENIRHPLLLTVAFGILYERAVLEWFDRVRDRLEPGPVSAADRTT